MSPIAIGRTTAVLLAALVALPATVPAQELVDEPCVVMCEIDKSGMDIHIDNTFCGGVVAIIVSPARGSMELPLWMGGGTLSVGPPWGLLALERTFQTYDLRLEFDPQPFADLGISVCMQAVSIDMSMFFDTGQTVSPENPVAIRISNLMEFNFAAEMAAAEVITEG